MAKIGHRLVKICPFEITTDEYGNEVESLKKGFTLAKPVKTSVSIETATSELYAGDTLAESIKEFKKGTITNELDDLSLETDAILHGEESHPEYGIVSKDGDTPTFCRVGTFHTRIKNNVRTYVGTIYMKVQYAIADEEIETKGENSSLKSVTLNGTLYRNMDGIWRARKLFDTAEEAIAYIDKMCNVSPADESEIDNG